jgi:hypothetical protein
MSWRSQQATALLPGGAERGARRPGGGPIARYDHALYAVAPGRRSKRPVVGAGVLTIDARELVGLAASMRVTHAHSLADKARAALRFGRFFMGELWDTYANL